MSIAPLLSLSKTLKTSLMLEDDFYICFTMKSIRFLLFLISSARFLNSSSSLSFKALASASFFSLSCLSFSLALRGLSLYVLSFETLSQNLSSFSFFFFSAKSLATLSSCLFFSIASFLSFSSFSLRSFWIWEYTYDVKNMWENIPVTLCASLVQGH